MSPQRMTDKCFRKCIGKPGGSLDNSEQVRPLGSGWVTSGDRRGVSAHARTKGWGDGAVGLLRMCSPLPAALGGRGWGVSVSALS